VELDATMQTEDPPASSSREAPIGNRHRRWQRVWRRPDPLVLVAVIAAVVFGAATGLFYW
jgi:hypothetical protein